MRERVARGRQIVFSLAAGFGEVAGKRALAVGWAIVLTRAFALRFVRQDHFMDCLATGNRTVKDGHDASSNLLCSIFSI
jgi:hypothetical protein